MAAAQPCATPKDPEPPPAGGAGGTRRQVSDIDAARGVIRVRGKGGKVPDAPLPAQTDVADVVRRVHARALVWLRRHRYLDQRRAEDRGNEPAAETPVDALARAPWRPARSSAGPSRPGSTPARTWTARSRAL